MNLRRSKKRWAVLSAAAVGTALTLGAAFWQPEVTGQDRSNEPQTTVSEREAAPAKKQANAISLAFRRAAELATPSVVRIDAHTKAKAVQSMSGSSRLRGENPLKGTPFEDMFPGFEFPDNFQGRVPPRDGVGSGVIIDAKGIVLTNNHVVEGADSVTVKLSDGREFQATDIKTDPASDLAVLRLKNAKNLPAAKLGDSDQMEIGDWVMAIGNPFELETTVSAGIISGKGRLLGRIQRAEFLQTDAAINPGNSGGPLVNLEGEVVGINTAIASNSGGYQGIGFAIPVNQAKWVTRQLVERGSVERGYVGVGISPMTRELAEHLNARTGEGVVVAGVMPGSPAAEAGLEEQDVIVAFNGDTVKGPRELQELVERTKIGERRTITVLRNGKEQKLNLVIKALPQTEALAQSNDHDADEEPAAEDTFRDKKLGIDVADLSAAEASQFGGQKGVLIRRVEPESAAAREGLRAGMLIRKVGRTPVANVEEYAQAVKEQLDENGVLLSVRIGAVNRLVVVNPNDA
ncbi:MAG: Do family serine endopeptidase [Pirellulales bacterium]